VKGIILLRSRSVTTFVWTLQLTYMFISLSEQKGEEQH